MRRVLGIAAVAGLLILVAVAAAMQGSARFDPPEFDQRPSAPEPPPSQAPQTIAPWLPGDVETNETAGRIVLIVLIVVGAAVAALIVFLIARRIVRAWRARTPLREAARPSDETFATNAGQDPPSAPTIRRGIEKARHTMDEHPDPSDAILAAWVGLEETVAATGTARGRSETPAEFALRIVTQRADSTPPNHSGAGDIAGDARVLLRLYERVRFAEYAATADDRARARRALDALEEWWQ